MISLLVTTISLGICSGTTIQVRDHNFSRRQGFRLLGSNPSCVESKYSMNPLQCAILCTTDPNCKSISYKTSDECCVFNARQLYDFDVQYEENPQWNYFGPAHPDRVVHNDWTLVFKAVSGSGSPTTVSNAWAIGASNDLDLTSVNPQAFSKYAISPTEPYYRSHWISDWDTAGITEVKLGLYENGTEVFYMHFDGNGSGNENWFAYSRLTAHPFVDILISPPAMFAFQGQIYRKFYVSDSITISNCNVFGWLIVLNFPANICTFDKEAPAPQFLYAKGSNGTPFSIGEYGKADVLAVFVKFS